MLFPSTAALTWSRHGPTLLPDVATESQWLARGFPSGKNPRHRCNSIQITLLFLIHFIKTQRLEHVAQFFSDACEVHNYPILSNRYKVKIQIHSYKWGLAFSISKSGQERKSCQGRTLKSPFGMVSHPFPSEHFIKCADSLHSKSWERLDSCFYGVYGAATF